MAGGGGYGVDKVIGEGYSANIGFASMFCGVLVIKVVRLWVLGLGQWVPQVFSLLEWCVVIRLEVVDVA